MRSALKEVAWLTLAAALLAFLYQKIFVTDFAWKTTVPVVSFTSDSSATEDFALDEIPVRAHTALPKLLAKERAVLYHREKSAVFLDARSEVHFAASHITAAVNVVIAQPERWNDELATLPRGTRLVIYGADNDNAAAQLYAALMARGFENIYMLDEDFESWKRAGYPVTP